MVAKVVETWTTVLREAGSYPIGNRFFILDELPLKTFGMWPSVKE